MEFLLNDFWMPVERAVVTSLPKITEYTARAMKNSGHDCDGLINFANFLSYKSTANVASYMLATFFLVTIMHAIRLIDLRIVL